MTRTVHFSILVGGLAVLGAATDRVQVAIPRDFRIEATYAPSWYYWASWTLTITSDGRLRRQVNDSSPADTLTLNREQLQELLSAAAHVRFWALDSTYSDNSTDGARRTLKVTKKGESHQVAVYGMNLGSADVQRFTKLWETVTNLLPAAGPKVDSTSNSSRDTARHD